MLSFRSAISPRRLDGDLPGQVARRHGRGHLRDRAHLRGQVAGQLVHALGEPLPGAGHTATSAWPPNWPSVPTSRATRVTSSANAGELVDHGVDVFFSSRISPRASTSIFFVRSPWATAVVTWAMLRTWLVRLSRHEVDVLGQVLPGAGDAGHPGLAAEDAFGADLAGDTGDLVGERPQRVDHAVDASRPAPRPRPAPRSTIFFDRSPSATARRHRGDAAHLAGQVVGHDVDVVGEVLPRAGDAADRGLAAELALGADLAGHPGDLVGEGGELVDHRVDGGLQLQDLAARVDGDLLRQVALARPPSSPGRWSAPGGQVAGHEVHRVGEVAPGSGDTGDRRPDRPAVPSLPTSRATRVTSSANAESWSTIVLTVFFSSRISPCASTVIFCDRSPRATAVVDLGDVCAPGWSGCSP